MVKVVNFMLRVVVVFNHNKNNKNCKYKGKNNQPVGKRS